MSSSLTPVEKRSTADLVQTVSKAAEAWFNDNELLALQELIQRVDVASVAEDRKTFYTALSGFYNKT